jgi:DNA-cytosine methyltransferase
MVHANNGLLTCASLFTGGAIADIGYEMAGFRHIWGIEYDSDIASVANANGYLTYCQDAITTDWTALPSPDLLHASPPCQDFSIARRKDQGISRPNQAMSEAVSRAIAVLQPKFVVIENVPAYRKSREWYSLEQTLYQQGYFIVSALLNAYDYGVPQSRRRFIAIASRVSMPCLPAPTSQKRSWDMVLLPKLEEMVDYQVQDCILKRLAYHNVYLSDEPLLIDSDTGISWNLIQKGRVQSYRKMGEPAFCIKASIGRNGRRYALHIATTSYSKTMTPHQLKLLQTIPEDYQFPCKPKIAYRIIGNAVPCLLTKAIGEAIAQGH